MYWYYMVKRETPSFYQNLQNNIKLNFKHNSFRGDGYILPLYFNNEGCF